MKKLQLTSQEWDIFIDKLNECYSRGGKPYEIGRLILKELVDIKE